MSDGSGIAKGLGGALGDAAKWLVVFLAGAGVLGTVLGHVLAIACAAMGVWFAILYQRYAGILAVSAPSSEAAAWPRGCMLSG